MILEAFGLIRTVSRIIDGRRSSVKLRFQLRFGFNDETSNAVEVPATSFKVLRFEPLQLVRRIDTLVRASQNPRSEVLWELVIVECALFKQLPLEVPKDVKMA